MGYLPMTVVPTALGRSAWRSEFGGYVRTLADGSTLSVRPSGGSWFWCHIAANGSAARYGRGFHRLSAALRAAEGVVAEALDRGG
jgi:hypothetical protein